MKTKIKEKIIEALEDNGHTCADCGKKKGENHLNWVCDVERCPKCKGQLLSCDCDFQAISKDGKYLIDKSKKRWKRFLVKNSIEEDFGEDKK